MSMDKTVEEQLAELRATVVELAARLDRAVRLVDMIPNPVVRKYVKSRIGAG